MQNNRNVDQSIDGSNQTAFYGVDVLQRNWAFFANNRLQPSDGSLAFNNQTRWKSQHNGHSRPELQSRQT